MAKRRTRKDKESVKHPFLITWEERPETGLKITPVKGQNKKSEAKLKNISTTANKANLLDKDANLSTGKHDVVRSLVVTSLIIGIELVIYLAWN